MVAADANECCCYWCCFGYDVAAVVVAVVAVVADTAA